MKLLLLIFLLLTSLHSFNLKIIKIVGLTFEKHKLIEDTYREHNKQELQKFFNEKHSEGLFESWNFRGERNKIEIQGITEENYIILLKMVADKVDEIRKYHGMTLPLNKELYSPNSITQWN